MTRPVERGKGGGVFPGPRDGAPPSLKKYIKYTRVHRFKRVNSLISKNFSTDGLRKKVTPGPAVTLDVPDDDAAVTSAVGELLQPVGGFEILWDDFVETGDDLVDGFLQRLFLVLFRRYRHVELPQCRLHDEPEAFRYLPPKPSTERTN